MWRSDDEPLAALVKKSKLTPGKAEVEKASMKPIDTFFAPVAPSVAAPADGEVGAAMRAYTPVFTDSSMLM